MAEVSSCWTKSLTVINHAVRPGSMYLSIVTWSISNSAVSDFFTTRWYFFPLVHLLHKIGISEVLSFISVMITPLTHAYYHIIHPLWNMKYLHLPASFYCFTQDILHSRPLFFHLESTLSYKIIKNSKVIHNQTLFKC